MNIFRNSLILVAVLLSGYSVAAQDQKIVYTDASSFPVYGKCIENTSALYERLPADYEQSIRTSLWHLGRNSAGIYVRFRSDSPCIWASWRSTFRNSMNHMTDTGTRGLDLYILDGKQWIFAGSGRPSKDSLTTAAIVRNMDGSWREYMLYLSLYDGVSSLKIGIAEGSSIEKPAVDLPARDRKIVMYGTSILEGGCANRPGMAFTAIIGRRLNREVINLGFSGNAWLDPEIAALMTRTEDPGVFVLDYVPNCSAKVIDEKGEAFFNILRKACPDVPVVFVENPIFPHSRYDMSAREDVTARNMSQKALFRKLKKAGEKNIYYVPADNLIGKDGEATVDGIHFTDLGMVRYSDVVTPVIRKALK